MNSRLKKFYYMIFISQCIKLDLKSYMGSIATYQEVPSQ